ncbi:MAG: threonine-phosphate decarboxylase CobD [Methylomonas sp.]|nr:threonine-phosphate decarboxylase CobD [Methylomonas sp.]
MLEHGGRLQRAAIKYRIPLEDWLDLSTGINPNGWPVPDLPATVWQRLPEDDDELLDAACRYYRNSSLLPVAGSQAAIQTLPALRPFSRVGVLHPAYAEHAWGWQRAGHELAVVDECSIDEQLDSLDVLIVVNPNNPTGKLWPREQLLDWHERLSIRGGWLIVDEAFIDVIAGETSLSPLPVREGLIVLRSIGKFFGLAGIRCGFVIAEMAILKALQERLGPWAISHPGRIVAAMALSDKSWQMAAAESLKQQGQRLRQVLAESGWPPSGGCELFQWLRNEHAPSLHVCLARQGILTRFFAEPASLRFGLPADEADWRRLKQALNTLR